MLHGAAQSQAVGLCVTALCTLAQAIGFWRSPLTGNMGIEAAVDDGGYSEQEGVVSETDVLQLMCPARMLQTKKWCVVHCIEVKR